MDDAKEYWIFADESVQEGTHFSNFFGGCIVPAHSYLEIDNPQQAIKPDRTGNMGSSSPNLELSSPNMEMNSPNLEFRAK